MNNSVKPKFGKTLKGIREDRDLSIRQFAKICDFSPAYISDLEKDNRKPTLELINRISNNLILTEEEKNTMKNAFIHDRLEVSPELLYYLIDNDLIESLKILKELDSKGENIKRLAFSLKNDI